MINEYIRQISLDNRSPETIKAYTKILRQFEDYMKPISIIDSKPKDVQNYINYLTEKGLSPSSVNQSLSSIKSLYKYLKSMEIIEKSPCDAISYKKIPTRAPEFHDFDEMRKILKTAARDTNNKERNRAIIMTAAICGLRSAEITGLNLTDFRSEELHVIGKGNVERFVTMSDTVKKSIVDYLKVRPESESPALFISSKTKDRMSTRAIRHLTKTISDKTGLSMHPHKFRHTAATFAYEESQDILAVRDLLGHTDIKTTQIYTHTTNKKKKGLVEASKVNLL